MRDLIRKRINTCGAGFEDTSDHSVLRICPVFRAEYPEGTPDLPVAVPCHIVPEKPSPARQTERRTGENPDLLEIRSSDTGDAGDNVIFSVFCSCRRLFWSL